MKLLLFTIVITCIVNVSVLAQSKCNTYSEPSIGLTFCAPPKWAIKKKASQQYADLLGPTRYGLTPNINVRTASFVSSLSKATDFGVEASLQTKGKDGVSKIEVKSRSAFAADEPGFKVVYDTVIDGGNLRSIQYFFKGLGDTKIVITATLPLSDADVLEKLVDASIKTLKITDKPVRIKIK